jgi:hypothetical protein
MGNGSLSDPDIKISKEDVENLIDFIQKQKEPEVIDKNSSMLFKEIKRMDKNKETIYINRKIQMAKSSLLISQVGDESYSGFVKEFDIRYNIDWCESQNGYKVQYFYGDYSDLGIYGNPTKAKIACQEHFLNLKLQKFYDGNIKSIERDLKIKKIIE